MSGGWIALYLLGGFAALVLGGEFLVRGASRLAKAVGVSALVVGLTVVAFGTSAPELAVSLKAALAGQPDVTIGNVVGSNIINLLVVLGVTAMVTPMAVPRAVIRGDVPVMLVASLVTYLLALDGVISRLDGVLLVSGLVVYTVVRVWQSRRADTKQEPETEDAPPKGWRARLVELVMVVVGLAVLIVGAGWIVTGAVAFAAGVGLSTLVVGLTVVALGTSLPEFTVSLVAALRGERDMAVGNAVGSNIFNLLLILGASALVARGGVPVATSALTFDFPVMLAVAVVCLPVFFTRTGITRGEGALFVVYYVTYTVYLLARASDHDSLRGVSDIMVWFVLPLCALSLLGLFVRAWWWHRKGGGVV